MAMLNRLRIQGIRSFGLNPEDSQSLEFSPPLVLIVGENGCGKTTIIECLKYALTGEVPPGSDKGKNFIHESKQSDNRKLFLGKVQLTVTDAKGIDKTVTRAMKLEYPKNRKPKFETLNSTISFQHPNGRREDISGRVDDINNYMGNVMGVSKAIINSVIFCHQEDSNWPLDEGKKLKEKFDAIFGTTEYNKAIDKLIKMRKSYQQQLTEVKGTIRYNEEIKNQVDIKEKKLQATLNKHDELMKESKKLEESLVPLQEESIKIMEKEKSFGKLYTEKLNSKNLINNKDKECQKLLEKISRSGDVERNMEVLEMKRENFESDRELKNEEMNSLTSLNLELQKNKVLKERQIQGFKDKLNQYTNDYQQLQNRLSDRFDKVREMCSEINIPFTDDLDQSMDTQMVSNTMSDIERFISNQESELDRMKEVSEDEDVKYQKQIDQLREERAKLETNIVAYRSKITSLNNEIKMARDELKSADTLLPMLKRITPEIEEAEEKVKSLSNENKVHQLEEQKQELVDEIFKLERELSTVDSQIDILHSSSRFTNELEAKQAELTKNQNEYTRIRNKSSSILKTLFPGKTVESNFRYQLQSKENELKKEVNDLDAKLKSIQRENERIIMQRENFRKEEERKEKEIKSIERRINDLCDGGSDYIGVLEAQKEKVSKLNMDLAVVESSKNTYANYIEKIQDESCCPVCSKDFGDHEADNLVEELKTSIEQLPEKIKKVRDNLKNESKKFDQLNSMKSSYDSLQRLKSERNQILNTLKELDKNLKTKNEERDNLEMNLSEPRAIMEMISPSILAEMIKLDDLQRTNASRTKEIELIKSKMPKNIPDVSLADATNKRKELMENIKSNREKTSKLEKEINDYKNALINAREKLNSLNAKKNSYQQKMQGIEKVKEQMKKNAAEKAEIEIQLRNSEKNFEPIKNQMVVVTKKKQECRGSNQEKIAAKEKILKKLQLDENAIIDLNKQISNYYSMNLENKIDEASLQVTNENTALKALVEKIAKNEKKIQEIRDFLNKGDVILYTILDNISLLKLEEEVKNEKRKYMDLKRSMGEIDHEKIVREKARVLKEIEEITKERQTLIGKEVSLTSTIQELKAELKDRKYRDAKAKYKKSIIEEAVVSATIDDLNKYRAVLEKSLLKYHQEKMDQINKTIKQLWNDIYKGNDIDYIMIKTDEEAATSSDKKRSYNYRVLQSKLSGELTEMRGRCSAGQKVLASLIIRIALADTFSTQCGILALDEPTTNLDSINVKSLSMALADLVKQRNDGKFMLIVITHDEGFVEALDTVEKYYRVSRNDAGFSRISEIRNF